MRERLRTIVEKLGGEENSTKLKSKSLEIVDLTVKKVRELVREALEIIREEDVGLPSFREDHILQQERFEAPEWVRSLDAQIDTLREYLPNIHPDKAYIEKRKNDISPKGTVKVIVPKLNFLAEENNLENAYDRIGVLIEQVCAFLDTQREGKFTHYRKGALEPDRVRCIQQVVDQRKIHEEKIPGDVMVLDVDMGNSYAGWTPRRARSSTLQKHQLALSSVDVAWILLLNPDRLQKNTDLSIDAVMEEYLSLDRGWVTNLFFYHRGGKLEFGYRWNRRAYFDCGAAIADTSNERP